MSLTVIQNTKINTIDFYFTDPNTVTYPVAPLISANFYDNNGTKTIKIRTTLYINSEDGNKPFVQPYPQIIGASLQLHFDYNFSEEIPENFDVWYMELNYTSPEVNKIKSVTAFLKDIDPETSKGTQIKL